MTQRLGATGLGLPLPQSLYPTLLSGAPIDQPGNLVSLSPGDSLVVPAGEWLIDLGMYCILQYFDPIQGVWTIGVAPGWQGGIPMTVVSDGSNVRVANLLSCPFDAVIANAGSGYVQASTTITPVPDNGSKWLPIVGGAVTTVSMVTNGAGYGVAPLVIVPPPPPAANNANGVGGVQCEAYAVISGGSVTGVSFTNPGAGYPTVPTAVIVPSPFDPNLNIGITQATVLLSLTGAGSLTGVLCTNSGAPLASVTGGFTLAVGGAGTSGSLTAKILQTITGASVTTAGTGFGASNTIGLTTAGGGAAAGAIANNDDGLGISFRPRPAQISLTSSAGAGGTITTQNGTIIDGGLFCSNPTAVLQIPFNTGSIAGGTIALALGSVRDKVKIQPAP